MDKTKQQLYGETIALIDMVEMAGVLPGQFALLRKRLLDIANDILRLGDDGGE